MSFSSTVPGAAVYSVQHVARLIGLTPATLRTWERRYGFPRPARAANGYRLYSEADLRGLRRLKARLGEGVRIGLAVEEVRRSQADQTASPSLIDLRTRVIDGARSLDETGVLATVRAALEAYPLETVMAEVLQPALYVVGAEWAAGRLSASAEHVATAAILRQVAGLFATSPDPWRPGLVLAAGAPDDQHELGLLFVTVGLRRRGRNVRYLGVGLPFDDVEAAVHSLRPNLIALSATLPLRPATRNALADFRRRMAAANIAIVLGGQGFHTPDGPHPAPMALDQPLEQTLSAIESHLERALDVVPR